MCILSLLFCNLSQSEFPPRPYSFQKPSALVVHLPFLLSGFILFKTYYIHGIIAKVGYEAVTPQARIGTGGGGLYWNRH
jgi:hypothetical protein